MHNRILVNLIQKHDQGVIGQRARHRTGALFSATVIVCASLTFSIAGQANGDDAVNTPAVPAGEARFEVSEFRVIGNTLLDVIDVESVLMRFLGPGKTGADVDAARQVLEQRYREAGYPTVLVNVPEQAVTEGVVRLQVVEGKVERLSIKGSKYYSLSLIKKQVPGLAEGAILYLPEVQRQMSQVNAASGDRTVTPVLRPGKTPGTVEAELRVTETFPLHGDLELNNRYSGDTSKSRLSAGLRYDNLWQSAHSLAVNYQTAPEEPKESTVWSGTYLARFTTTENVLVVYGVQSDSETAAVGDLNVIGKGRIMGVRGILPLVPPEHGTRTITLGLDYKDFDETITVQGSDTLNTPITYVSWLAQYGGGERTEDSSLQWSLGAVVGIRGIENSNQEFANKRYNAKANFLILKSDLDYQTKNIQSSTLRWHVAAQLCDAPLISNEQFFAGGADSVRGYKESQAPGDYGAVMNIEWSTPSYAAAVSEQVRDLRALFFIDAASLRLRDALPGQDRSTELYSTGIGLRTSAWSTLSLDVDLAMALKEFGDTDKNEWRVHGRLSYSF